MASLQKKQGQVAGLWAQDDEDIDTSDLSQGLSQVEGNWIF